MRVDTPRRGVSTFLDMFIKKTRWLGFRFTFGRRFGGFHDFKF